MPHVVLGGEPFALAQDSDLPFRRLAQSLMLPRQEVDGVPGAQNLSRTDWFWTHTDFSGGEGQLVFVPPQTGEPGRYKSTDGGIDVRTRGEFKMSPVTAVVIANDGGATTTRWEGNTLTLAGNVTATGSDADYLYSTTTPDSATKSGQTPGAVAVTAVARLKSNGTFSAGRSVTVRLRVRNTTDSTDAGTTSVTISSSNLGTHTLSVSFTGTAAKTYSYIAEVTAAVGAVGPTSYVSVDYIEETSGGTAPTDVRHVTLGVGEEVYAFHWDTANTDVYRWDFTNDMWDVEEGNAQASLIVATASSDHYIYLYYEDGTVDRLLNGTIAQHLGAARASTTPGGIAIGNNRLYVLTFDDSTGSARNLHECTLDGAAAAETENTAGYKRVMTSADFPNEPSHDTTLRQIITGIPGGVRFIVNGSGGTSSIYEFSNGAGRQIATLEKGYTATCIFHYQGITFIGVTYGSQAASPAEKMAALWYLDPNTLSPRELGPFRFHDPDDERVAYIDAWGGSLYAQQGKYLWAYSGSTGGIVLDTLAGPSADSNARSFAVMDTKKFMAFSGEGVHVSQDSYPIDQTVYLYSPIWDFDVSDVDKVLIDFKVVTKPLPAATEISLDYMDDEDGTWTTVTAPASASLDGATTHTFTVWGTAASPTTENFRNLQWRVGLRSSDGASSPTIRSITARARPIAYEDGFRITVRLDNENAGLETHLSGREKAELLWALKTSRALVSFEDRYSSDPGVPDDFDTYAVVVEDVVMDLDTQGQGVAEVTLTTVTV